MITLTRLTGAPFALNPDLVERVDSTPDTVITLVDGTKYLVAETLQQVADTIVSYRASIIAMAGSYASSDTTTELEHRRSRLSAVPSEPREQTYDDPAARVVVPLQHDDPATFEPRTV
jgi:flagellar protein FlbD